MAAPELPDREEGTGESPSPRCWRRMVELRLCRTVGRHGQQLTAALADEDPAAFQRRLARHLQRMPRRYLADVDADDKAKDVLLHWRILDECADPNKRPVLHARFVKSIKVRAGYSGSYQELVKPCQRLTEGSRLGIDDSDSRITSSRHRVIPLHEVIICCIDRPRLLCQLATLLEEVGLHIREGHLYCTTDAYCLALFLVDGWETEESDGLIDQIKEILAMKNAQQSNPTNSPTSEDIRDLQQILEMLKQTGENIASSAGLETDRLIDKIKETLTMKNYNSTDSSASKDILELQQILEMLKLTGANANTGENIASPARVSWKRKETEVSEDVEMAEEGN